MTKDDKKARLLQISDNHDTAIRSEEGQIYSRLTKLAVDLIAANKEMRNGIILNDHAKVVKPKTKADHVEYARSFLVLVMIFAYMKNESLANKFLKLSSGQHFTIRLLRNNVAHEGLLIPTNAVTINRQEKLKVYSGFAIPNSDLLSMAQILTKNEIAKLRKSKSESSFNAGRERLESKEEDFRGYVSQFSCGKFTFVTPLLHDIYSSIERQTKHFLKTEQPELQDRIRAIREKEDWRTVEDFLGRLVDLDPGEFPEKPK